MQVIHPVCWGIDAHAAQLTACLRRVCDTGQITTELHDCGTTYRERVAFRTWLQDHHCPVSPWRARASSTHPCFPGRQWDRPAR